MPACARAYVYACLRVCVCVCACVCVRVPACVCVCVSSEKNGGGGCFQRCKNFVKFGDQEQYRAHWGRTSPAVHLQRCGGDVRHFIDYRAWDVADSSGDERVTVVLLLEMSGGGSRCETVDGKL